MVLGNPIKLIVISIIIITTPGWSFSKSINGVYKEDDFIEVHDLFLRLLSNNNHTVLEYSQKQDISKNNKNKSMNLHRIELKLKPPSKFLRRSDGKPRYYAYKQFKADIALIAIGNPIQSASDNKKPYLGTELQGIIIYRNEIKVSDKVLESTGVMIKSGVDEKDYYHFARMIFMKRSKSK